MEGKARGRGKENTEAMKMPKEKGKRRKARGKNSAGKFGGSKGGFSGEQKGWYLQGQCRTCGKVGHKSTECRWGVAYVDEEDADSRKNGGQPGEVGGVRIVGNVLEIKDEEETREYRTRREAGEGTGRPRCRSKL